jgi:hypothetical protein
MVETRNPTLAHVTQIQRVRQEMMKSRSQVMLNQTHGTLIMGFSIGSH